MDLAVYLLVVDAAGLRLLALLPRCLPEAWLYWSRPVLKNFSDIEDIKIYRGQGNYVMRFDKTISNIKFSIVK